MPRTVPGTYYALNKYFLYEKTLATCSEWPSLDRVSSFRLQSPGPSSNPTSLPSSESDLPAAIRPTQKIQTGTMPSEHPKDSGRDGFSPRTLLQLLSAEITVTFLLQNANVSLGLNELQGLPFLMLTAWDTADQPSLKHRNVVNSQSGAHSLG